MSLALFPFRRLFAPKGLGLLILGLVGGVPLSSAVAEAPASEGLPLMQTFTPRDFHAEPSCQCIVQDARGVLYVGNTSLVLEYDGSA